MNHKYLYAVAGLVLAGLTSPGIAEEVIPWPDREPAPMILEQEAIESSHVEVVLNSSGEVVQVNACESDYLCTVARLLPAPDIEFFHGSQPINLWRVRQLNKEAATIIYRTDTRLVERVRFFDLKQEGQ